MRKDLLIIALGLSLASSAAMADVLATPETDPAVASKPRPALPEKGISMAAVEKKFGAPMNKRPTVGGDTPKHPPITRWDYDGFSVIFEHDKVVDAVIPGAPPRVYNKDRLTPVAASAAPLPPMAPASELAPPPPAEEPVVPPPAEAPAAPAAPAEEAAASAPAETVEPMTAPPPAEPASPPPASQTAPASSYPDRPPAQTPTEEVPEDSPPTPK